jgi:hypothetical protein
MYCIYNHEHRTICKTKCKGCFDKQYMSYLAWVIHTSVNIYRWLPGSSRLICQFYHSTSLPPPPPPLSIPSEPMVPIMTGEEGETHLLCTTKHQMRKYKCEISRKCCSKVLRNERTGTSVFFLILLWKYFLRFQLNPKSILDSKCLSESSVLNPDQAFGWIQCFESGSSLRLNPVFWIRIKASAESIVLNPD